MNAHLFANAKAYAALIGSVCTALLGLGIFGTGQVAQVLTLVAAVATAVATWRIPNLPAPVKSHRLD